MVLLDFGVQVGKNRLHGFLLKIRRNVEEYKQVIETFVSDVLIGMTEALFDHWLQDGDLNGAKVVWLTFQDKFVKAVQDTVKNCDYTFIEILLP